jgi:hypothetical protein
MAKRTFSTEAPDRGVYAVASSWTAWRGSTTTMPGAQETPSRLQVSDHPGGAERPLGGHQESRRHHEKGVTMPGFAYTTEVNKGSVNMHWLTEHLNRRGQQGWRLHAIFEQDKNTVMVFERPTP